MTKKVFTIGAHRSIPEAATMMRTHFVHHLVVVDVANEVVGVGRAPSTCSRTCSTSIESAGPDLRGSSQAWG